METRDLELQVRQEHRAEGLKVKPRMLGGFGNGAISWFGFYQHRGHLVQTGFRCFDEPQSLVTGSKVVSCCGGSCLQGGSWCGCFLGG